MVVADRAGGTAAKRLVAQMAEVEAMTAQGRGCICASRSDYSARDSIEQAARCWRGEGGRFASLIAQDEAASATNVDLLIRTGGDRLLSDFMLWEAAFAELYFTDAMWPDFDGESLAEAVGEFRGRHTGWGPDRRRVAAGFCKHFSRREREGPTARERRGRVRA